jgi:hypothetical protein
MDTNGILSIVAIVISIGGTILSIINHKRIRSNCCGKEISASLDVENTTPPDLKIEVPKPSITL